MGSETFVEIILAILLPPLGVFLRYGCGVMSQFFSPNSVFILQYFSVFSFKLFFWLCSCFWFASAGRVLDLFVADHIGIYPWNYICNICAGWLEKEEIWKPSFNECLFLILVCRKFVCLWLLDLCCCRTLNRYYHLLASPDLIKGCCFIWVLVLGIALCSKWKQRSKYLKIGMKIVSSLGWFRKMCLVSS